MVHYGLNAPGSPVNTFLFFSLYSRACGVQIIIPDDCGRKMCQTAGMIETKNVFKTLVIIVLLLSAGGCHSAWHEWEDHVETEALVLLNAALICARAADTTRPLEARNADGVACVLLAAVVDDHHDHHHD